MSARVGIHLALAIAWCLLWGSFGTGNLVVGLAVGLVVVTVCSRVEEGPNYTRRLFDLVRFIGWFFWLLLRSNLQIAREILTPGWSQQPRIIRYPVEGLTPVQTTVLANSITLTPGTLAVDVSDDGRFLYLHCMYAGDSAALVCELDELRGRMERWVFGQ